VDTFEKTANDLNLLIKSIKVHHDTSQTFEDDAQLSEKSVICENFSQNEKILMSVQMKLNWKNLIFHNWATLGITSQRLYIITTEDTVMVKVEIDLIQGLTYNKNVEKEFLVHVKNQDDLYLYKKKRDEIF